VAQRQRSGQRLLALSGGLLLPLAAAAVVVALSSAGRSQPAIPRPGVSAPAVAGTRVQPAPAPSPSPSAIAPTAPSSAGKAGPRREAKGIHPVEVRIPAIDVRARVIDLGLNSDGTLEVPESFDEAGWWTGGAEPGADGPAVVVGHVDSRAGPGVFYRLREVVTGDRIELQGKRGRVVRFTVDRVERHPKNDFPTAAVYGATTQPTLRLITCGGAFDRSARSYVDNVIVYASLGG
jgi:hypothetical protein